MGVVPWVYDLRMVLHGGVEDADVDVVVALGACAHTAGVNALKNIQPSLQEAREYVYSDKWEWYDTYPARPISAVIPVDAVIPGCPIDRFEFLDVVKKVLLGKAPTIPDYPVCVPCYTRVRVTAAEEERPKTYLVRSLTGKLSSLPDQVRVYISKRHKSCNCNTKIYFSRFQIITELFM